LAREKEKFSSRYGRNLRFVTTVRTRRRGRGRGQSKSAIRVEVVNRIPAPPLTYRLGGGKREDSVMCERRGRRRFLLRIFVGDFSGQK
jgi:hypothetical protein